METSTRLPLGRDPQSALKLSHFVERPTPPGVVGTCPAGHALALTFFSDTTTPGALPSGCVVLRRHRRYYDPLGLPLHSARLRLRLIRVTSPRHGPCRRASPVPHRSLNACCAPYPGGTRRAFCSGLLRGGRGLRRDVSGSAPRLNLTSSASLVGPRFAPSRGFRHPARATGISPCSTWDLLPGAPALTRTGLSPAGTVQREAAALPPTGARRSASSGRTTRGPYQQ